ncbi:MAG: substrate-binding domain-containing protein [Desulfohalobiaceae bacterium]
MQFRLLSTREVARLLGINEKQVYRLIQDKDLPATKATGKWLFPEHLIRQWIEAKTINYPGQNWLLQTPSLFVVAGSNDILLERSLQLFMSQNPEYTSAFSNLGSMGGLRALRQGLCHIATSHLMQKDSQDFNFDHIQQEMQDQPAVVNFCLRQQGLILAPGNPQHIQAVADLGKPGIKLVNRQPGTGTRLWLDRELEKAGLDPYQLDGYQQEMPRHLDLGLEILAGRADAGPGIRTVAGLLGLDFLPLHWERFDLLISKERFFEPSIQSFLNMLMQQEFKELTGRLSGYDLSLSGRMLYPARMPDPDQKVT